MRATKPKISSPSANPKHVLLIRQPADVIEIVIAELCCLSRAANLALALQVGEIVFVKVFGGDMSAVRSRGRKDASFARLAKHPKLPFSASTLWRSVAIYELKSRFPVVATSTHLGVAHLRAVLDLPGNAQEKLLRAAEKERWSRDLIEQQAKRFRVPKVRSGRRPAQAAIRCVRLFDRLASAGALVIPDELTRFDEASAARARDVVRQLRGWCDAVEASLGTSQ